MMALGFKLNCLICFLQWCSISTSDSIQRNTVLTVLQSVKSLHPQQPTQLIWTTSQITEWRDFHDAVWTSKIWSRSVNIHFIRLDDSPNEIIVQLANNVVNIIVNPTFTVVRKIVPFICMKKKILYLANESSRKWLSQCSIPIDCAVYTVLKKGILFEAYNISENMSVERVLSFKNMFNLSKRRSNLTGLQFKVASVQEFKTKEELINAKEYLVQAYFLNVFYVIQEFSNFTFVVIDDSVESAGHASKNGIWTGLIGMLQKKEIDIGISYVAFTPEKMKVMDISAYIMNDVYQMYLRTPANSYTWRSYITPFRFSSWMVVLAVSILIPLIHFKFLQLLKTTHRTKEQENIFDSYMMVIRGICSQGSGIISYSWTKRTIDITVLCWGCIIMSLYTKILYSQLATVRVKLPYNSLFDILNSNSHSVKTYKNGFAHMSAMTSSNNEMKLLWEKHFKKPENQVIDVKKALDSVCNTNSILFTPKKITEPLMNSTRCLISAIPGKYFSFTAGFGMPKNSPYSSIIDYCIFHLRETGILSYLEKKYMTIRIATTGGDKTLQIGLVHIYPILGGFCLLTLFSCIILQIEILYDKVYKRNTVK